MIGSTKENIRRDLQETNIRLACRSNLIAENIGTNIEMSKLQADRISFECQGCLPITPLEVKYVCIPFLDRISMEIDKDSIDQ